MNPPAEQLIRDYLNRVSVAARGRLPAEARRAFLAGTREFIEQNTRAVGRVQTADVLKLLSELGDPVSLVQAERQRLAAGAAAPGAGIAADTSLGARARRLRAAPANVASLLRASAAVVAPGDAPAVPEPAGDNPMTGDFEEIVQARRPINSRWRPGQIVVPRQPGQRRPGLPRRPGPGAPAPGGRTMPPPPPPPPPPTAPVAPAEPAEPTASPQPEPEPAARPAPLPRPEWPSVAARRGAPAEDTEQDTERDRAGGSDAPGGTRPPDWASLNATEAGWADPAVAAENWSDPAAGSASETGTSGPSPASLTNGTAPGSGVTPGAVRGDAATAQPGAEAATPGSGPASPQMTGPDDAASGPDPSPVSRNTLIGPPPAPAEDTGPQVPPRGARVTWASGVRSRTMRVGARRGAGTRLSGTRPGGRRDGPEPAAPVPEPDGEPGAGWEFLATAGAATGKAARLVVRFIRQHPLETAAVLLLGLGGLIYPPVWVMGALVAMMSKLWDIRDKWIGLGLPVFLVIVGIVVEVSLSGNHKDWTTYVRDAWVFAGHLSRILALLGAVYLAWRAERGRRSPTIPPWRQGRRFG